ncbi:protein of unknown function [Cyclobacterium lianum]|uniref:DUF4221 domain-containing protein n=1 Tax=Cyclobacterium lianum TaxID=388280 RepID=A0A1M7Q095_9BACT|nr:DUF4221 family protein [Cyclobacterium lianum]SHN23427.1 protein of unknown function [Cyclobacterium lianum]
MSIHFLFLSFFRNGLCIMLFFCISCGSISENDQSSNNVARELRINENSIQIPLDEETSHYSMGLDYFKSERPLLFNFNHLKKCIQVYDMQEKLLSKEMKFEKEGSEGIGSLTGFYVHDLDSIFIFTTPGTMYLTDLEQSYLSPITLEIPDGYVGPVFRAAPFNSNPIIRGDKMLAKVLVPARLLDMEESQLSQQFLSAEFSLDNGKGNFSAHKYPKGYLEEGLKAPYYSMAASPDRVVYSFFADHRLHVAEGVSSETKTVAAKSQYLPEIFPSLSRTAVQLEYMTYLFTSPRYEGLIYDKYREIYYRFCYPSIEISGQEEINQLRGYPKDFSIMILDSELNILGETRFTGKHLVPNNVFVAEEGLYISANHPDNPNLKEDWLEFKLLELVEVGS